jgi:putative hydrolase of the HAD superfamily
MFLMNKTHTLILDLDDTLVHCNKYFHEARDKFVKQMQSWFHVLPKEKINQKQLELDIKGVEKHGLHSSVYIDSLVKTYQYFCIKHKRRMREKEIERVRRIGQSVFQTEVQPFPYMYEVLNTLRKHGHQLHLFTGGDKENQTRKISQLALDNYFEDRIFIYEHKNSSALQDVLDKIKPDKKSTWMIGNSLKTDIKPAIELGINAIHIPTELEWSYNITDIDIEPSGTFAELESLSDLPDYLTEYNFFSNAKPKAN